MGEYRSKSGVNMPNIGGATIPNIPNFNALKKNQGVSAISEMDAFSDFAREDPTDVGSADDILAAVGGIDSLDAWDNVPDSGYVTSENRSIAESIDDLMAADDDKTTVTNRSSITPASQFNLPSQRVPTIGKSPAAPAPTEFDDSDSSKTEMVESPFNNAEFAAALAAAPVSKPIAIPGTSTQAAPKAPASPSATSIPKAPASPSATSMPKAPAAPSVQTPAAPAAHSVQMQAAAPAPAPEPAPAMPAHTRELTDEEQLQVLLDSMSPEERLEYERYSLEQEQRETERRREKQREMMEMYGNPGMNTHKNSGGPVLAIVIILILGVFGAGLYFLVLRDSPDDAKKDAETAQNEVVEAPKPEIKKVTLSTYSVNIKTNGASTLFINGVETPTTGSYQFVSGRRNSIMAYADGMVPFFKTFDGKSDVTETIEIEMVPDTLYLKGKLDFRLSDVSNQGNGLKAMLDGRAISNFPSPVNDVVLGRPHILTLEKPGLAKHMHLIWPVNSDTTVTIPQLVAEDAAAYGTKCSIKKFVASAKPYGIKIIYGDQEASSPIVATVPPGEMIQYYITHDQRHPLQVAVIPDGYGTLQLDTNLLRDSIGESIVSFKSTDESLRVCLRRPGELICPPMSADATVPSGPDWEIFGATGTEANPRPVRGGQGVELQSSRKFTFEVGLDAKGTFTLKQTGYDRIKKPGDK